MSGKQAPPLDAYAMLERFAGAEYARAERWEALARQLGDVLERYAKAEGIAPYDDADVVAALGVYRDAIKEET